MTPRIPLILGIATLALGGCSTTKPAEEVAATPSIDIDSEGPEVVTQVREVARPCSAQVPRRPDPLPDTLPSHPVALAALLGAKLAEYSAPGEYADQAEAYFKACPPSR